MLNTSKIAVVIFIYNRQQSINTIISQIKQYGPSEIFLIADGPKYSKEIKKVNDTRELVESLVDWPCKIHKYYSKTNLGLKDRFCTGINWVFKHVDKAIFIEDDSIPNPSFFLYCQELLEKYQNNPKIITISGDNFQLKTSDSKYSYYFSRYPHIWGWATWKRVWDKYDSNISDWPEQRQSGFLNKVFPNNFFIRKFWTYIFDRLYAGKINTWDYQLTYLSFKNSGLNIIPLVNLVSNVGYGSDATNLKRKNKTIGVPANPISLPLKHPHQIIANVQADNYISELAYLHPLGKLSLLIKSILGLL